MKFDVGVDAGGDINGSERDGMMDVKRHPTTTTPTILVDESVAGDVGKPRVVVEFGFLKSRDADAFGAQKVSKIIDFALDSVAVPLEDGRSRRRKRT